MSENSDIRSRSRTALWIVVFVTILVVGVYYVRATGNPQSLVGRLLRGEALSEANSSQPDWRESSLRPNEFRLTVVRVVDDSDQLIVRLTVETLQPQWHEISWRGPASGGTSSGVVNSKSESDEYFSTTSTLNATQIAYRDIQLARCSLGGGSTATDVPLKTPMEKVLAVTVKDGIYPLHQPLVIGQKFGVDAQLVVGERSKVEASTMSRGKLEESTKLMEQVFDVEETNYGSAHAKLLDTSYTLSRIAEARNDFQAIISYRNRQYRIRYTHRR